jgi:hypothetical protein
MSTKKLIEKLKLKNKLIKLFLSLLGELENKNRKT